MIGECFLCKKHGYVEVHHLFGNAMRKKSTKYGLTVNLCPDCHRNSGRAVHKCGKTMLELHQYGQRKAMEENGWSIEDFRREFYKSYL